MVVNSRNVVAADAVLISVVTVKRTASNLQNYMVTQYTVRYGYAWHGDAKTIDLKRDEVPFLEKIHLRIWGS
eukprot:CAMPEP_0173394304 /NCGR_PEP_ID=MMETSP1356-20130122/26629_1 /TAXON_ID=77927 ORGANISM="Hemiselmis virescens, Strain PCC157" /NCGR_SAMPLE_ID=MMETSP1356 /ASSEMBLY_ACC=CAM_ASM_000847 /LENGTH=71 /DNA_ID=CAMNT_0014352613 /DNA_START=243 /DNA_END=455 /DNA_ORIENTATION=-